MNDACPCKNCNIRYLRCHSECIYYNSWKAKSEKQKEYINKQRGIEHMLDMVKKNDIRKWKRKNKRA